MKSIPLLPSSITYSIRTGQPVAVPSFEGWTPGDVAQWQSEHQRYVPERYVPPVGPFVRSLRRTIDNNAAMWRDRCATLSYGDLARDTSSCRDVALQALKRLGTAFPEGASPVLGEPTRKVPT